MKATLHQIVQGLSVARLHATRMAEQWPHHAPTLMNFHTELMELQLRLVAELRQDQYRSTQYRNRQGAILLSF